MMRSMFAAISGLKNHQTMLDVTANDIANVNTVGYKSARTTFKDSLAQMQRGGAAATGTQGGSNPAQVGLGVQLGSIDNVMTDGTFQSTGKATDIGIQGGGFFVLSQAKPTATAVQTPPVAPDGSQFTRAGNFTTNSAGDLVTADGFYVVGLLPNAALDGIATPAQTGAINIPSTGSNIAVAADGTVTYMDGTIRRYAGRIQLASFSNPAGLERASGNRWSGAPSAGTASMGTPGAGPYGPTVSGVVEMSNVDLSSSFTQMITAQRGFQANSRVISTSDELLQDLVNLKR